MSDQTPDQLWGIWGNPVAVRRLRDDARQGPRHAYILSGPASIGKLRLATRFAAALVCPNAQGDGQPCGVCSTCRRVLKGVHPDVLRFDLAGQMAREEGKSKHTTLNISTVREISRIVAMRPVETRWRIIIVDDAETMQEPAQEAFLKTLEEPPSYAIILLLTTDAELLLPTIHSRCAIVTMTVVPGSVVESALLREGASKEDARDLALASRGHVGLALRAREDEAMRAELVEMIQVAASWIGAGEYERVVESIRWADRVSESRDRVVSQLLAVEDAWRELMLDAAHHHRHRRHPVSQSFRLTSLREGHDALVSVDRCLRDLDANVRPRSALASMVLGWPAVQPAQD